ncbi:solute carrier family 23 member 1 [Procambarus clarkii]|uniref:solute carrier family 23 member 1 n=1 Tax=Procambarus clarkii TaxID=6728 RepID=UPI001E678BB4|nr:solute carrier family 23 member 1-like [Procambarus clarkii]
MARDESYGMVRPPLAKTRKQDEEPLRPDGMAHDLIYSIEDVPPWYLCLVYGFQHYLAMIGGTISKPIILASFLCLEEHNPARGALVSTIIFMSGVITLLQSTIGVRLPIIQGGNFAYVVPTVVLLTTSYEPCSALPLANFTSTEREELWQVRMRDIQGAITLSALFQVIIGFSGMVGVLLRWITPLTVVPTVTLVGLSLFDVASKEGSGHWGVCLLTVGLAIVFSQHMRDLNVPFPIYKRGKGLSTTYCQPFKTLSLLLAIIISWGLCALLTKYDVLPEGSPARTDRTGAMLDTTPWLRFPYPGQWGVPTVSVVGTVGMLAAVFSSIIESVGDYYACARVAGAPLPPTHAINRGIGVEGIGCMMAGLWGTGSGTTSYSGNIGVLSITKVGSRRVVQYSGIIMVVCGVVAKVGAMFVTIPGPVIGGIFIIKFSMITAVGISTLQHVDLTSSRNLFVLGFSIFFGLSLPKWLEMNPSAIKTGEPLLDQTLLVLLHTPMFLGGLLGLILDNTVPGTDEERGVARWRGQGVNTEEQQLEETRLTASCYQLPFGTSTINKAKWMRHVPFCPTFSGFSSWTAMTERLKKSLCQC